MNESKFLTIEEAAQLLGVSHWRIRQLQGDEGRLTRFKVGNRTVVSRHELLELMKAKQDKDQR